MPSVPNNLRVIEGILGPNFGAWGPKYNQTESESEGAAITLGYGLFPGNFERMRPKAGLFQGAGSWVRT